MFTKLRQACTPVAGTMLLSAPRKPYFSCYHRRYRLLYNWLVWPDYSKAILRQVFRWFSCICSKRCVWDIMYSKQDVLLYRKTDTIPMRLGLLRSDMPTYSFCPFVVHAMIVDFVISMDERTFINRAGKWTRCGVLPRGRLNIKTPSYHYMDSHY